MFKDGYDLLYQEHQFKRNRKNINSIYWICKHEKCSGSVTVGNDDKIIRVKAHIVRDAHEFKKS